MYCNTCESNPCTCTKAKPYGYPKSTYTTQAAGITKEEFGINLFEVIKTISGLLTLRQQLNQAIHQQDGPAMTDRTARYKEAQAYLANQLPTLTDHEMAQVLEKYPSVVTM